MGLRGAAVERGVGEHADAHDGAGIVDLDANLGGADGGVEDGADVGDGAGEGAVGVGGEMDVGFLAEVYLGEIVLVDVADDPDVREVGDGEGGGGARVGDAGGGGGGDVLRDDVAGGGGVDLYGGGGVRGVDAEDAELLLGGGEGSLGIVFGVLGDLELAGGDGALVVEELGPVELNLGEAFVVDGLEVVAEGAGDVGALDLHQELALVDEVTDARVDVEYAAGRDGDYGDGAGHVRG